MIFLNFKTYPESTGQNSLKLLDSVAQAIIENSSVKELVYVAPSIIDLGVAKNKFDGLNIMAQHVDTQTAGSTTGWITADNIIAQDITYTLYNHSEHRVFGDNIVENINYLQSKGLKVIFCCENIEEAKIALEAKPFAIAYEPKELIGSGVSVTTKPEAVAEFIALVKGKSLALIGAGVSTKEDIKKGIELGADGALLASAFVKAADPKAKLMELVEPFLA
jgi:triosephosphate isomerase